MFPKISFIHSFLIIKRWMLQYTFFVPLNFKQQTVNLFKNLLGEKIGLKNPLSLTLLHYFLGTKPFLHLFVEHFLE